MGSCRYFLIKGYAISIHPFSLISFRSQSSSYLTPLFSCAFAVYHKYSRNLKTAAVIPGQTSCVFLLRSRRRRKPSLTSPTGREAKWTAWRFCRNPTLKRRLGALLRVILSRIHAVTRSLSSLSRTPRFFSAELYKFVQKRKFLTLLSHLSSSSLFLALSSRSSLSRTTQP